MKGDMKLPLLDKKDQGYSSTRSDLPSASRIAAREKNKAQIVLDVKTLASESFKESNNELQKQLANTCLQYCHQVLDALGDEKPARAKLLDSLRELNSRRSILSIFSGAPSAVVHVPVRPGVATLAELIIIALCDDPAYEKGGFDPILRELFNLRHELSFTVAIKNFLPLAIIQSMLRYALPVRAGDIHCAAACPENPLYLQQLLIQNRSLLNKADEKGHTALHIATRCGAEKAVQFLLKEGAKVSVFNNVRDTPIHLAVAGDNREIIKLLYHAGGHLLMDVPNKSKATPKQIYFAKHQTDFPADIENLGQEMVELSSPFMS